MFKFSLQSVLNHRLDREEECQNDYKQAQRAYLEECEKTRELQDKIYSLNEHITKNVKVEIFQLQQLNVYKEQLRKQLEKQELAKAKSQQQVKSVQKQLLQAMTDVQVIDTLKQKQYEVYLQEELAVENRLLDELACINYGRLAKGRI